jgi:hypothetical protein
MKKKFIQYYVMKIFGRFSFIRPLFTFSQIDISDTILKSNLISTRNKISDINSALKKDGCYLDITLTNYALEKVKTYAFNSITYAYQNPSYGFKLAEREKAIAIRCSQGIRNCRVTLGPLDSPIVSLGLPEVS